MTGSNAKSTHVRDPIVRKAAVAGQFYPKDPAQLADAVKSCLAAGQKLDSYPPMIISPHAGYIFSGPVAGLGFATIDPRVAKVILIGPSHHKAFEGLAVPDADFFETPLGRVPVAQSKIAKISSSPLVHVDPAAHEFEHSLEVQLPFLQVRLGDFAILPIVCNEADPEAVAQLLLPLIDDRTLIVISSDLSHYHPYRDAKKIDALTIRNILETRPDAPLDACGSTPIRIGLRLAQKLGLSPRLIDARNSFDTAPAACSDGQVVGYGSVVFVPGAGSAIAAGDDDEGSDAEDQLSFSDKAFLLRLAREALERAVRGERMEEPQGIPSAARQACGCFVTLTIDGELRGCIGYLEGIKPLYEAVVDNARNAALSDYRFNPVTAAELEQIRVEVSVLTLPQPLDYRDAEELLAQLVPHRDGLILVKDGRQATFLPQVWEQLPDKVDFLEHLALKAGLSRGDWKAATYKRYRAIHFQEP
jgi:AmmeMemoRadiSam system protein B/AmmeMemoRadiSam system protein A